MFLVLCIINNRRQKKKKKSRTAIWLILVNYHTEMSIITNIGQSLIIGISKLIVIEYTMIDFFTVYELCFYFLGGGGREKEKIFKYI